MATEFENPIVVGVDGSSDGLRALRYAVRAAHDSRCGVRLVHVLPDSVSMLPAISRGILADVGGRIVSDAMTEMSGLAGDEALDIEQVVRSGSPVHILADEADRGRLIVLGHRDRSLMGRVFTASTTTGVATRAHRPVVCVPASWTPGSERGHIVVGVDDPSRAEELLAEAFATAAARSARLTVIHAWKLLSPYDDIIASRIDQTPWQEPVRTRLVELVRALQEEYPGVDAHVDILHQQPAAALLDSTRDADLLILGRRGHGAPLGFHLGVVARAMIRVAHCPVQITPLAASLTSAHEATQAQDLASSAPGQSR